MLDVAQFRTLIVRPVLQRIELWSPAAENLLVGTALKESGLRALRQYGGGPALGLYQMEPATHDDLWKTYLDFRAPLAAKVAKLATTVRPAPDELIWNLAYATAMCRVRYLRASALLPDADEVADLAAYWKQNYNTPAGAGDPADWARLYLLNGRPGETGIGS